MRLFSRFATRGQKEHIDATTTKLPEASNLNSQLDVGSSGVTSHSEQFTQTAHGTNIAQAGPGGRAAVVNLFLQFGPWGGLLFSLLILSIVGVGYRDILWSEPRPELPSHMPKDTFNIAVAGFSAFDRNNNPINSEEATALSQSLYRRLESELTGLDIPKQLTIWSPEQTGTLSGLTKAEREIIAASLAQRIEAHVIVYGVITESENGTYFTPEFYVSTNGFAEASELVGPYELGGAISLDALTSINQGLNLGVDHDPLTARVQALSLISVGLAYYVQDKYELALNYFLQAEQTPNFVNRAGKEIAYLLIGNTYVRQMSQTKVFSHLPEALESFEQALAINPNFARAQVGKAGTLYLSAITNGNDLQTGETSVDLAILDSAEDAFLEALRLDAPDSAHIPAKVHFHLGQLYQVRAILLGEEWSEKALTAYQQVIQEYEENSEDEQLRYLASQAYARLALMDLAQTPQGINQAIANYEKAAKLASPFWQAYYFGRVADLYADNCQFELAREFYEKAFNSAYSVGHQEKADEYDSKQKNLHMLDCDDDIH